MEKGAPRRGLAALCEGPRAGLLVQLALAFLLVFGMLGQLLDRSSGGSRHTFLQTAGAGLGHRLGYSTTSHASTPAAQELRDGDEVAALLAATPALTKQSNAPASAKMPPSRAVAPVLPKWGPCQPYLAQSLAPGARRVAVATVQQLQREILLARPGSVIVLADGVYDGMFNISAGAAASGRPGAPITLCGSAHAVLRGPSQRMNQTAVLTLVGVEWWQVVGLTIENGYKAVWAQGVRRCLFEGLTMRELGEEGIRLCFNSTHNTIANCTIYNAGSWMPGWGEGIYLGTSQGQWVTPDRSNHNRVLHNRVGPGVAAECLDVKEWTEGTLVEGNYCDGGGLTGENFAKSLISIKGSKGVYRNNVGVRAYGDGHGIHTVVREGGWGDFNLFEGNIMDIQAGGYGIRITRKGEAGKGNVVKCSNSAPSAGSGLSNVRCTE